MEENFNTETCINTLRIMSGNKKLNEMPHYDTLNYYLEKLSPECFSGLRKKMVISLIRGKQFNKNRLLGKYWRVILDGTGLFYFKEKHCDNANHMEEVAGKKEIMNVFEYETKDKNGNKQIIRFQRITV